MDRCTLQWGSNIKQVPVIAFFDDNYLAFDAEFAKHLKKEHITSLSIFQIFVSIDFTFQFNLVVQHACGHMTIMNWNRKSRKSTLKGPRKEIARKKYMKRPPDSRPFSSITQYPNRSITLCQLQEGSN